MTSFLADLPFYVLATFYFLAMGATLFWAIPLLLRWAILSPDAAQQPLNSALISLAFGLVLMCGLLLILSFVPLGAMPCGPRFGCPSGAQFVRITEFPILYLLRAAPVAVLFLFAVSLIVSSGRALVRRDAA